MKIDKKELYKYFSYLTDSTIILPISLFKKSKGYCILEYEYDELVFYIYSDHAYETVVKLHTTDFFKYLIRKSSRG